MNTKGRKACLTQYLYILKGKPSRVNKEIKIGEIEEDGTINPYTIRFICKNGTEINCKDKYVL